MTTFLQFLVLGFGAGAVVALLATSVLVVYKGSGVLNFAAGALAMVGGFVYWTLRANDHWPAGAALIVAAVVPAVISAVAYALVIRQLAGASLLAKVIASLALLITIEAAANLIWGVEGEGTLGDSLLPTGAIHVGSIVVPGGQGVMCVIAVVVTLGLWAAFRFTTVGLATAALAENRRAIAALGWTEAWLATGTWVLGGLLAGFAGALVEPLQQVQVATTSLLVIPALAAALIARFTSFPTALAAAITLGVAQSEVQHYISTPGWSDAVPFLVIIVFLAARGKTLPGRGELHPRMPAVGSGIVRWPVVIATSGAVVVLMSTVFSTNFLNATIVSLAYGLMLVSVVVLTGYAGQLSLGVLAFAGLGALVAGRLVAAQGWPLWAAALAGLLAAVPIGVVFGLPALRTRGVNLAVVTLGLATAVQDVVFNNPGYTGVYSVYSGTFVGNAHLFGFDVAAETRPAVYASLEFGFLVLTLLAVATMRRGRVGRRLIALRENERAAAALGINVVEGKLYAFVLASMIAALGGILLAFQYAVINYGQGFDPITGIFLVAFTIVGGVGFLLGPLYGGCLFVAGGVAAYAIAKALPNDGNWLQLVGGLSLMLMLTIHPDGMFTLHARAMRYVGAKLRRRALASMSTHSDTLPGELGVTRVRAQALEVSGLTVRFGGVVAVDNVALSVVPGEVVGLIGPNGAGKTTTIDAISGFVNPTAGDVRLGGRRLGRASAHTRARAGLSRSFQSLELFEDLTVRDNLRAASDRRDVAGYLTTLVRSGNRPLPAAAVTAVHEFGLEPDLDARPGALPYGRRRLVAVARALALEPSVLLLDEPAAGLDSMETAELADCVRRLADMRGIGVLVVEHDMSFVMSLCDRIVVLDFGRKIAEGSPAEIRRDPAVVAAYLGEELDRDDEAPVTFAPAEG